MKNGEIAGVVDRVVGTVSRRFGVGHGFSRTDFLPYIDARAERAQLPPTRAFSFAH